MVKGSVRAFEMMYLGLEPVGLPLYWLVRRELRRFARESKRRLEILDFGAFRPTSRSRTYRGSPPCSGSSTSA